jgi:hypothetical protein
MGLGNCLLQLTINSYKKIVGSNDEKEAKSNSNTDASELPTKYSETKQYETIRLSKSTTNNSFVDTIPRLEDSVHLLGLTIEYASTEKQNCIQDVEIEIGGITYVKVPYSILLALADVQETPTKTFIKIDFSTFIREITLIRLAYHEIKFRVNLASDTHNIATINLHTEYHCHDVEYRRALAGHPRTETPIQYFETIQPSTSTTNTFTAPIRPATGYLKGVVVEYPAYLIENVNMTIGKHDRFNYTQDDLRFYSQKLTDTLTYIPLNIDADIKTLSMSDADKSFSMHGLRTFEFYTSNEGQAFRCTGKPCCGEMKNGCKDKNVPTKEEVRKMIKEGNDHIGHYMTPQLIVKTTGEPTTAEMKFHAVVFNVFEIVSGMAKMVDFLVD